MTGAPRHDRTLDLLGQRVREARTSVDRCRSGQVGRDELARARHELVLALQAYVSTLESRKLPVPRRMHAELRLHRDLFDR